MIVNKALLIDSIKPSNKFLFKKQYIGIAKNEKNFPCNISILILANKNVSSKIRAFSSLFSI